MPVVTPSRASTDTVNAVPSGASLWSVIWRSPSSSQRSSVRHRQMRPRACVAMKLIASGVANWAAMTRSPSFSRSGASTTTTNLPWRMSSIASSIVANGVLTGVVIVVTRVIVTARESPADEALDVLGEHVRLEIDLVARLECREGRHLERVRHQRDREAVLVEHGDGQGHAVDRHRALLDAVGEHGRGRVEPDTRAVAFCVDGADAADSVHVALDVVT